MNLFSACLLPFLGRCSLKGLPLLGLFLLCLGCFSLSLPTQALGNEEPEGFAPPVRARVRVIVDNDFGGDPDGLFQLAQQLLSPSVEVRAIIGSHHYPDGFYGYPGTPAHAVEKANELLAVLGLSNKVPVFAGADKALADLSTPQQSEAARFIVNEAMREGVREPLFLLCGAGLTDSASAYLQEPRIAERLTLVWIGGPEHPGVANPPPGKKRVEYNLGIDKRAAQVIFNRSAIPVWQVPRDAYRQALVSFAELNARVASRGRVGGYLLGCLRELQGRAKNSLGETYVLGDSPLVLLSALQTSWEADPASSRHLVLPTPTINEDGGYAPNPTGRPLRVYTQLDTRLLFEDLYAKIATFDGKTPAASNGK